MKQKTSVREDNLEFSKGKRRQRRKLRAEQSAAQERLRLAALAETEVMVLEIEVRLPKAVVNYCRQQAYGLEGDEEHDTIMQACVNKINNKPLRDFTITGWGFKEKDDE